MPESRQFLTVQLQRQGEESPMGTDELGGIEWLATCNKAERSWIRRHADVVTIPAGTVLVREGEGARWFYAVIDGEVAVSVDGDHTQTLGRGEPVNEIEVLRNEPSPATVAAATDVRVLVMGRREFLGMLDEVPGLARRLLVPHIPAAQTTTRRAALVPLPAA
jgi:CRP-like cAMP-binding protein